MEININNSKKFFCSVDVEVTNVARNPEIVQFSVYPEGRLNYLSLYILPDCDCSGKCANKIKTVKVGNYKYMTAGGVRVRSYTKDEARNIISSYIQDLIDICNSQGKELYLLSHNAMSDYVHISSLLDYRLFNANILCTFRLIRKTKLNTVSYSNYDLYSYYTGLEPLTVHNSLNDAYMNLKWFELYVRSITSNNNCWYSSFISRILGYKTNIDIESKIDKTNSMTWKQMIECQLKNNNSRSIRNNGLNQVLYNPHNEPNTTFTLHHSTVRALSNLGIDINSLVEYCKKGVFYLKLMLNSLGYKGKKHFDIYRSVLENANNVIYEHCGKILNRHIKRGISYLYCITCNTSFSY